MPRSPRVRAGDGDASPSSARRAWLSQLKEDVVRQLPPTASPAVRARLRSDVEHALRHHGPDDPALELQDILATLVAETRRHLNEVEHEARRSERKAELLACARQSLAAALDACPSHLVGTPSSHKRTHTARAIWADLRPNLEKTLSGAESEDVVGQRVDEHVAQWRSAHDRWWRPRLPAPVQVARGIETATAIVDAVNKTPALRQLADIVTQAVLTRLRQRRPSNEPPPSAP
jgi:hypothetical protein